VEDESFSGIDDLRDLRSDLVLVLSVSLFLRLGDSERSFFFFFLVSDFFEVLVVLAVLTDFVFSPFVSSDTMGLYTIFRFLLGLLGLLSFLELFSFLGLFVLVGLLVELSVGLLVGLLVVFLVDIVLGVLEGVLVGLSP